MKKIKINIPELIMFGVMPAINVIAIFCAIWVIFTTPSTLANKKRMQQTIEAYRAALHRVWLENPSYMGDYFVETDEMFVLDSLDNTMLHDVFTTHSALEKEEYEYNQAHEAEHVIIRHDPGCCTVNIE